jgi:hypothetical protein
MKNIVKGILLAALMLPTLGVAQEADHDGRVNEDERVVTAAQVPALVMATAKSAKPGSFFMRIMRKLDEDDETYYVFNASQIGKYWVITVRADGELVSLNEESGPPNLNAD